MPETLIVGARLFDPESGDLGVANLGIDDRSISYIGPGEPEHETRVDAGGLTIVPGFIDIHVHEDPLDDSGRVAWDSAWASLRMGVTAAIGGNCGIGQDTAQFLDAVKRDKAPQNIGLYVPHAVLRERLGIDRYEPAAPQQIMKMRDTASRWLDNGAVGISFGLEYTPGASTDEMIEIGRVTADYPGRLLSAHYRYDCERGVEAIRELARVARETGAPFQVSHINSCAAFGNMDEALSVLDEARAQGHDVLADCYPYDAFCASIGSPVFDDGCLERWGVGYDSLLLAEGPYAGERCSERTFAETRKEHPRSMAIAFVMRESEVLTALNHQFVMVGSDGRLRKGHGHPRGAGTFPRVLGRFVRDGRMEFQDALRKMTCVPAGRLGLSRKGRLVEGMDADLAIIDPETLIDTATYEKPASVPLGIRYMIVGGKVAAQDGLQTGVLSGSVLPAL